MIPVLVISLCHSSSTLHGQATNKPVIQQPPA